MKKGKSKIYKTDIRKLYKLLVKKSVFLYFSALSSEYILKTVSEIFTPKSVR